MAAGLAVLLLATGCQMKENAQFSVADDDRIYLSGRTSAEIKWQYEVTCEGNDVCMSEGLKNADWATTGDGRVVVDVLVKWFDGRYGDLIGRSLGHIRYNGERCLVIPADRIGIGYTLGAHSDCRLGESMQ